ncbi:MULTISPECIES: WxL domain-containing protein [unclassified Enterococcus]|uniref:WxL domain-containing protein n=1 Tax=unclassified Enterococcus TaxID=2608891 RepID=UPI001CE1CFCB|nr:MULTISPECIES: WxL domain-containing protein [unclassified Enterococcus]MCA5013520.1 WxL domain-containing protein [Enterococcus sp. S23]MCA5016770.1 WxL domain-containing protein [Enterococcus sp. S22(2020)]
MKKMNIMMSGLLLSVGTSTLNVQAEENVYKSEGTITYTQGNPPPVVTPPGSEGPEITEPDVNPTTGPLMIIAATPIDFGVQETTIAAKNYFATDFQTSIKGSPEEKITTENFLKFRDLRATDDHRYKLYAQMTKQFTQNTSQLKGAALSYSNLRLLTTAANMENMPAEEEMMLASTLDLVPGIDGVSAGEKELVFENESAEKGFGTYDITFGEYEKNSSQSIKLAVPGNLPIIKGQYVAEITWTMSDTF